MVSYQTVLKKLVDSGISSQDIYFRFATSYKKQYGHDLKNHFEPLPQKEWVAQKEIGSALPIIALPQTEFLETIYKCYEKQLIDVADIADILQCKFDIAKSLTADWDFNSCISGPRLKEL